MTNNPTNQPDTCDTCEACDRSPVGNYYCTRYHWLFTHQLATEQKLCDTKTNYTMPPTEPQEDEST